MIAHSASPATFKIGQKHITPFATGEKVRSLTLGEKKGEDATLGETCLKIVRGVTQIESEILMTGLLACIQDNALVRFNIQ